MGSPCELQLFAEDDALARRAAEAAMADVARLEARYSRYRDDSLLAEINRVAALGGEIEVDAETASLLDYAATCHAQSDGLFDITSGVLRHAWRFSEGRLPKARELEALLSRIGWQRLEWRAPTLRFPTPGLELDFGGVVKEYAADRAATLCREAGIVGGVVNLGGDIRVIGPRADGSPWRIGIKHPRREHAMLDSLELSHGALATSGDYERCMVVAGQRYGHVLNPKSGWPVRHLASVSVVAEFCVVAGSASTIAMLKEEQGPAWLAALGLPHLWVDVHGEVGGTLA
ncbi:MAG: FAD:protein FMN transferase [Gammaproteobacteria bacterium]|nr:FAD:protein FMN transferase [Gammaproteobacteria bacterium]